METKKWKNIPQLFQKAAEEWKEKPVFLTRSGSDFSGPSFRELFDKGAALASSLIDLGVSPGEHVAVLSDNRLEWALANYGIQLCGAVDVPRGTDLTDQDIQYILSHAETKIVFVEHKNMLAKLLKNKPHLPKLKHVILMDPNGETEGQKNVLKMYDLIEKGEKLRREGDRRTEERTEKVQPDDLCTLIYTSGTTGTPKGVMLTHANLISQVMNVPIDLRETDRALSILPVWHIFERTFEIVCISRGMSTYYTNIRDIREDMQTVRPTFMASAPRLWENIYLGLMKKIKGGPAVARALFQAAYFCAARYKASVRFLMCQTLDLTQRNWLASLFLRNPFHFVRALVFLVPHQLLNFVVLRKVRTAMGGCMRASVSGGGALPLHVDLFFNNIGLTVLEGYGITETSPVLAVRTFSKPVIGSVGPIWPKTQLRLIDTETKQIIYPDIKGRQGEIHVKGPQVMTGYYKDSALSAKVLRDGWFNTGDLGMISYNNTLKITGRSKDTIVLLGGENVEPVPIENKLLQSDLIEHCMITGQDQKFLTCLVVPSADALQEYGPDCAAIAANPKALEKVQNEVKAMVSLENGFKPFEQIVDCRLLKQPFLVGEELTNIFKLKRHVIAEKYKDLIASMYM